MLTGQNWRWVFWILTMFAGFCFFVILFFVPETYAPALLMAKARKLRKETGEERWYAPCAFHPYSLTWGSISYSHKHVV